MNFCIVRLTSTLKPSLEGWKPPPRLRRRGAGRLLETFLRGMETGAEASRHLLGAALETFLRGMETRRLVSY